MADPMLAQSAIDRLQSAAYEGRPRIRLLGGQGMALKPAVEVLVAGLEAAEVMVGGEALQPYARAAHASRSFGYFLTPREICVVSGLNTSWSIPRSR